MPRTAPLLIAAALLTACSGTPPDFRERGYFKDPLHSRVYAIEYRPDLTAEAVEEYAGRLFGTDGRLLEAYFFPRGARGPGDRLTLAPSLVAARRVLYDLPGVDPWRYAYQRPATGPVRFVDCDAQPTATLCRRD